MHPSVRHAIEDCLANANHTGKTVSSADINELQSKLTVPLPEWYVEIMSAYPLAGLSLNYPLYEAKGDDDGYCRIKIATVKDIYSESVECYPGLAITELGYAFLAIDPTGGGDSYFMKVAEGDNPSVYQVYHDVSDIGTEIEAMGMVKIANSLSEFFGKARA
ncbi:MAG TPA: SMI1/KNR4 family protein [Puia sp.]|uniref:SMI1/KNR4 family protein n=1 Tax=Puia sp. TaxID=2045100 RepID=UPI002C2BDBE1|nr:SMI1/KNR4 family protein [Puia sp.]HVU95663.1 SMI1/KNR4 family protein [Puia sp.]